MTVTLQLAGNRRPRSTCRSFYFKLRQERYQKLQKKVNENIMKFYKRAAKLVLAANPAIKVDNGVEDLEAAEEDCDDDVADPTYHPSGELLPPSSPDVVPDHQQHCEYTTCNSEVFAACFKCNSFLCWYHFEDPNFANDCSKHNASSESLMNIDDNLLMRQKKSDDSILLSKDKPEAIPLDATAADSSTQQCEFSLCSGEVFTTCMKCQCFLCTLHFEDSSLVGDCSNHTPFSKENPERLVKQPMPKKESIKKATKRKRNNGLEYINSVKKLIPARSMKPTCGQKCRLKCYEKIDEQQRQKLFDQYWALGDITRQRDFINFCTEPVNPQKRNQCDKCHGERKQRGHNYAFYLHVELSKIRVCKEFFKATLDINDRVIGTVRAKVAENGYIVEDLRGKHQKTKLVEETDNVRDFINSIPRIESHYLRAQTSREFIEGGKTLTEIYNDYKLQCEKHSKKPVSKTTFCNIFHKDFNISFFTPKKDRCELCVSYENSNDQEKLAIKEQYETHQKEKQLSREEKHRDKQMTSQTYVVACYDLQAVLTTPRGEVSVFYYISKLATYNLTIAELVSSLTTCFVWHEGQGNRGVTEIGSCLWKFLTKKSEAVNSDDLQIVFYSDNCCGQQKNKFMIALYVYAVIKLKIKTLTHKFLIKGHTQNEGDSVHSTIEKQIKRALKCGSIYSPQEYVSLIKTAKKNPPYYKVEELDFSDFYDLKQLCEQIGSNFSRTTHNENMKLTDFKIIEVRKDDPLAFYVKTSYADVEFKRIEIRKHNTRKNYVIPDNLGRAYKEKIPVSEKKKQEILKLIEKNHIPKSHFDFYNGL